MSGERELDDLVALLPPLLRSLDALQTLARRLDPSNPGPPLAAVGEPDAPLGELARRLAAWPDALASVRDRLTAAAREAEAGLAELRASAGGDMRALFRALRHGPRAQETLYPLAAELPPVSRFFLHPLARGEADLQARLAAGSGREDVGVMHGGGEPGARGAWSLYVPEDYEPDRAWPLVMALHGGAGNGRAFLWSWLADARSFGALLVAPTALGRTWALSGRDVDTPRLTAILEEVRAHWNVDPARILLTGMSDGGTFSYVSGLEPGSPFSHLAPASAAFHPLLAEAADEGRLAGLPIHIAHGARDWMFPVEMAREAARALAANGAAVTYREVPDLGHAYPRELNRTILAWLGVEAAQD